MTGETTSRAERRAVPARRSGRGLPRTAEAVVRLVAVGIGTGSLGLLASLGIAAAGGAALLTGGRVRGGAVLRLAHDVAERDRRRLHHLDRSVLRAGFEPAAPSITAAFRSRPIRRELLWTALSGTVGLVLGLLTLLGAIYTLEDLTFPLWWQLVPPNDPTLPWPQDHRLLAHDLTGATAAVPYGLVMLAITLLGAPAAAVLQTSVGRVLLNPPPGTDLRTRVTELTASRAAALEAHTAELRRIERALHDGSQSRLVAVSVLVGAARRSVQRGDPAAAEQLERAQQAAEDALTELRGVVRGILPPVLHDRGLAAALQGLTERAAVPTTLDVDDAERCAASIEATVYFVVAEALTNISRHSRARWAAVRVTRDGEGDGLQVVVRDDGVGGAAPDGGTGLAGIRSRVLAHDGTFEVRSPAGGPTEIEVHLPRGS